ncbi:AAEL001868-PA [Aedes aegypti]|uniref:AAEL001868-PA n=1 Tax=Aedes aegypti TaxID=7159 RepID=Q17K17_AEDAE|nr:AAEL001868-PA [Aedes aegypti]
MFTDLTELLDHKKSYCKLRFTCKCVSPLTVNKNKSNPPSAKLLCVACKDSFSNPWDLMVHAQAAHMVNIYELGDSSDEDKASSMSSDSLADSSVNESSSTKRLTNGSDKSGETNGTHHEDARNHHVNGKSSEQNEISQSGPTVETPWNLPRFSLFDPNEVEKFSMRKFAEPFSVRIG